MSAALTLDPDAPDALFNYGNMLRDAGRLNDALAAYDRALAAKPEDPAIRNARAETLKIKGNGLQKAERPEDALACYDRALADMPLYPDALNDRARVLWSLGRFDEALMGFDAALTMKPDHIQAHCNRGTTLRDMLRLDEAMQSFDRAIVIDPTVAPAYRGKAFCALLQGDFAQGLPLYEWRKSLNPPIEARNYSQPLWSGTEDIRGKTVHLYVEQGLGDAIQFYRFVTPLLARGAHVVLSVQKSLLRLLENATPKVELRDSKAVAPAFDYHVPLMSLPLALNLTVASIPSGVPYLKAEAERVAHWRRSIGEKGFKIGISWHGARSHGVVGRAMPLACFQELSRLRGVRLISLQKGFGTEQLAGLPDVESLGEDFDSGPDAFLDSAAVMECLDLVITLDSAVAHLAGALGRPVWVALKRVPEWRWLLGRSDSPWYPTMRLFRQKTDGDWTGVFTEMQSQMPKLTVA